MNAANEAFWPPWPDEVEDDADENAFDAWLDERGLTRADYDRLHEVSPEVESSPANDVEPEAESINDLRYLPAVWMRGAARIRELAGLPVVWAWQDYVVAGTIAVIAGPPGGGKTTLLFLLMLARAAVGKPITLLDRLVAPAPPRKFVVLIEGEHGEPSTARKLLKSAELLGLGDDALDRLITVARKAVTLESKEWCDVVRMIKAGHVSDIAIDTIARVAPADANNEQDQAEIFGKIATAIEQAPEGEEPVAWLLAHTRKSGADALEDVSGSVQRVGQADSVIIVNPTRDDSGKVTASWIRLLKAREEPAEHPKAMALEIADGKVSWHAKDSGAAVPAGLSTLEKQIVEHLQKQTELRTTNYIAAALGGKRSNADVGAALEALSGAGHVVRIELGVTYKGKCYDGWTVAGGELAAEGAEGDTAAV